MRKNFLPFALPDLGTLECANVAQVLASGWVTLGPRVHQFESEFAAMLGADHALALNSCTAALHLALEAAGVGNGDWVITTPYTFAATAEVIRYLGATPVFVDVEADSLNIDPRALRLAIQDLERVRRGRSPRTPAVRRICGGASALRPTGPGSIKAIVPVHIAGHPCNMDSVLEVAAEYDLAVIEDAAHALPAGYRGRMIGSPPANLQRWAACFSFYATKTITTGEGGMITTNNACWAERIRIMSLHGISADAWKRYSKEGSWYYEITAPGYKYNMTDLAAAIGLAQLSRLEEMWQRRSHIAHLYDAAFAELPSLEIPNVAEGIQHSWHLYMLRLNNSLLRIDRGEFITELQKRNISSSVHFIPLHLHPYYREIYGYQPEDFPVAVREFQREISLPIYSKMTDSDVADVISAVYEVVQEHAAKSFYAAIGH